MVLQAEHVLPGKAAGKWNKVERKNRGSKGWVTKLEQALMVFRVNDSTSRQKGGEREIQKAGVKLRIFQKSASFVFTVAIESDERNDLEECWLHLIHIERGWRFFFGSQSSSRWVLPSLLEIYVDWRNITSNSVSKQLLVIALSMLFELMCRILCVSDEWNFNSSKHFAMRRSSGSSLLGKDFHIFHPSFHPLPVISIRPTH